MQAYSNPERESEPTALPDVEVFYMTAREIADARGECPTEDDVSGWYYWFCFPGCLPDSDPIGPFASEQEALNDAQESE